VGPSLINDLASFIQRFEALNKENIALKKELQILKNRAHDLPAEREKKEKKPNKNDKTPSLF
jgi:hypothetical protein